MDRNNDLTLDALFLGDEAHHERLIEHRNYADNHGVDRTLFSSPFFHSMEIRFRDLDLSYQSWYRRIFMLNKPPNPNRCPDDWVNYCVAYYGRLFGDTANIESAYGPYYEYNSGTNCDCCGVRLNIINRAKKYFALCENCEVKEMSQFNHKEFWNGDNWVD